VQSQNVFGFEDLATFERHGKALGVGSDGATVNDACHKQHADSQALYPEKNCL
jgi:hypothetical protein